MSGFPEVFFFLFVLVLVLFFYGCLHCCLLFNTKQNVNQDNHYSYSISISESIAPSMIFKKYTAVSILKEKNKTKQNNNPQAA